MTPPLDRHHLRVDLHRGPELGIQRGRRAARAPTRLHRRGRPRSAMMGSTIGTSAICDGRCRSSSASSAVLSPAAPPQTLSPVSDSTTRPRSAAIACATASAGLMLSCFRNASRKLPGQSGQLAGKPLGQLAIAVGDDRAGPAALGNVQPRLHGKGGGRRDAGQALHRPRAVEPGLHRAGRRQELLLVGDERDLPPRDRGLELAAQDGHEQASGELPGVAHGVRLRAVRDQGVAAVDHALREVGVVVEGQHDRGIGADDPRGRAPAGAPRCPDCHRPRRRRAGPGRRRRAGPRPGPPRRCAPRTRRGWRP